MEVITIESKAFEDLSNKIDKIADYVVNKEHQDTNDRIRENWLDSNQVADILEISIRTLQRLRKENLITYCLLRGKCYYKITDIETALNERIIRCKPQILEDFRNNYLQKINRNNNEPG